ncbi:lysM domain-containing GPI-anchored protein 2-like isoform X2 [Rhododendron vialii]|uniref:lysM domain-containing GPI-anchored protein 2-like isoform X2 n=1 Tax=Rhododendron vialii TaxID=182163 RepID=UPI00265EE50D|nr:lysM domain-containing GPI-anchored protein 2-like isoform X2 [Rhododendron vialii]
MGFFATALLAVFFAYAAAIALTVESFNCSGSSGTTCNGLVGYVPANATTLSNITTLFAIQNSLNSLLGANNFPLTTAPNQSVSAQQTVRIPFPCICRNGTGYPVNPPVHTVVSGDTMSNIATVVFSGLVTYQQIQAFNNVTDASLILIGQELKIPLPCSCDEVGGERVVHYGYAVESGDTVGGIAQEFNTTEETLLALNGLSSPKNLLANVPLDVPLKACTTMVGNNSLDYPLLVANGTYIFTAGDCVMCSCNAANNWTLQCEPSQAQSTLWTTCPSLQCQGAESLYIGNTTTSSCNRTSCTYAGYNNQTISTTLTSLSTCPASDGNIYVPKFSLQGQSWSFVLMFIHLVLLYLHLT